MPSQNNIYREPNPKEWERCVQKLYFWATVQQYSAGSLGDGGSGRPVRKEQKSALRKGSALGQGSGLGSPH